MAGPWSYLVYGLRLASDRPLPGLPTTASIASADVTLTLIGNEHLFSAPPGQGEWILDPDRDATTGFSLWHCCRQGGIHWKIRYFDGRDRIEFVLAAGGERVRASWSELVQLHTVVAFLLGPVLGAVLRLRGVTCLHAGVVAVGDGAVAFMGLSGAGKSSIVAALAERGFPVVADDLAVLDERSSPFRVLPGYPRLRLRQDIVEGLSRNPEDLDPASVYTDKRYLDLSPAPRGVLSFQPHPLPLLRAYLLEERRPELRAPSIEPMAGSAAVMALVANGYGDYMVGRNLRAREFQRLRRLVACSSVKRLHRPDDLRALRRLCELVEGDLREEVLRDPAAAPV